MLFIQLDENHPSFALQWQAGFGAILPSAIAQIAFGTTQNAAVLSDVLVANLPQIGKCQARKLQKIFRLI